MTCGLSWSLGIILCMKGIVLCYFCRFKDIALRSVCCQGFTEVETVCVASSNSRKLIFWRCSGSIFDTKGSFQAGILLSFRISGTHLRLLY